MTHGHGMTPLFDGNVIQVLTLKLEIGSRVEAGETFEILNEVRLVEIATIQAELGPVDGFLLFDFL